MSDQPNELAGIGTTTQMNADLSHWQDRVGLARQSGASWDDIRNAIIQRRSEAAAMGIPDADINHAMGVRDAEDLMTRLSDQAQGRLEAAQPPTPVGADPAMNSIAQPIRDFAHEFADGLRTSSGGLILGTKSQILPQDAGFAARLAFHAGENVGDIPAMVVGGALGRAGGAMLATAVAGPEAAPMGAVLGQGAGAMALPEFIKQEYATSMTNGEVSGPGDFASRQMAVLWNTAKQGLVGALTGGAGKLAKSGMQTMGASELSQLLTKTSAELATLTTAGKAVEGQLPNWQDLIDGAVLLAAMHGAAHVVSSASTASTNLLDNWAKTGQQPVEAVWQAANDPVVRQRLTLPFPPEPPPGSSEVPTPTGSAVFPHSPELAPKGEIELPASKPANPAMTGGLDEHGNPRVVGQVGNGPEAANQPVTPPDIWEGASGRWAVETQPSFIQRMKTNAWSVYQDLFNKSFPVNQLQQLLIDKKVSIPDALNPKVLFRIAELSSTTSTYMVEKGMINGDRNTVGPSLNEIVKPFDKETGNRTFWNYALARVALSDATKDTGLDLGQAAAMVKDGDTDYSAAFDRLVEWRNGTLRYARDHGTVSDEDYQRVVANAEAGLPVRRQELEGAWEHANGPKGKMAAQNIGEREGSELPILNMRAQLMQDAFVRVGRADANRAVRAAADLASQVGLAERVSTELAPKEPTEETSNIGWTTESDLVSVWRDGQKETWRFADPAITNFIRTMNEGSDNSTTERVTAWLANIQRQGITLNPLFPLRLLTYDVPWQFITKPGFQNTISQVATGVRALIFGAAPEGHGYDEWLRSGGAERVFKRFAVNDYVTDILKDKADPSFTDSIMGAVKAPFNALQNWSHTITQFQRVGKFVQERQGGASMEKAGALSTDASFHRPGFGGALGRDINSIHPFFAAYLNGLEQTAKSLLGIGKTLDDRTINPMQTILKASIVITAPVMWSYSQYKDEEWYKAVPEWQKDAGFFLRQGVFIPLPPVLNFVFGAIPRRLTEAFIDDNPNAAKHLLAGLGASFAPPMSSLLAANIAAPILEKIGEKAFVRGEPEKETDKRLPADRWGPYTTETAKGMAKFLSDVPLIKGAELTPYQIDNFIQAWSGSLGMAAVKYGEMALQQAGVIKPNAPALRASDFPLLSSWTTRYPTANAQPILDYEDRMRKSEELHGSLHQLLQTGDVDRFLQLVQENPASTLLHARAPLGRNVIPGANDTGPETDALKQAASPENLAKLRPDLEIVLQVSKGMTAARTFAQDIGQLPVGQSLKPAEQRTLDEIVQQIGGKSKPELSANDKRQLLDQTYSIMQMMAERGLKSMDRLHME
jgi:hypothetical protein